MLKSTHERIVDKVYRSLPKELQEAVSYKSLIRGSKFPDLHPKYRLMIHDFNGSSDKIMSFINEIITKKHSNKQLGFKLGIINHFLADYCCAFHSNKSYIKKHLKHHRYEMGIDKLSVEDIDVTDGPSIDSIETIYSDIETYLTNNQSSDVKANQKRDLHHALTLSYSLTSVVLEEYLYQRSIDFSQDNYQHRVVIFSDTYYPHINGVSNTLKQYIRYLKQNHQPYLLITPKYKESVWDVELGYHIHKVKAVKFWFYPQARVSLPNKHRLNKILDEFKPDVIHALTEFTLGYYGLRYAKKNNIPFISNYSSYFHLGLKAYKVGFVEKPFLKYLNWFHQSADLTTCPSSITKSFLLNQGLYPIKVFSRGVDLSKFSPKYRDNALRESWDSKDKIVFLYTGRVSGEKDIEVLCEAYQSLSEPYKSKATVVITGDGPILEALKNRYQDIIFTGFKTGEALSRIYASADVFSFPSAFETFGNVVLEAMASGLPCIVVNEGGVLESVTDSKNGLIVPKKDIKKFARAMKELIENNYLRNKLSLNALLKVKSKTWEKVFEKLQYDYSRLIDSKKYDDIHFAPITTHVNSTT